MKFFEKFYKSKKNFLYQKKKIFFLGLKSSETSIESISGGCPKSRGGGLSGVEVKIAKLSPLCSKPYLSNWNFWNLESLEQAFKTNSRYKFNLVLFQISQEIGIFLMKIYAKE